MCVVSISILAEANVQSQSQETSAEQVVAQTPFLSLEENRSCLNEPSTSLQPWPTRSSQPPESRSRSWQSHFPTACSHTNTLPKHLFRSSSVLHTPLSHLGRTWCCSHSANASSPEWILRLPLLFFFFLEKNEGTGSTKAPNTTLKNQRKQLLSISISKLCFRQLSLSLQLLRQSFETWTFCQGLSQSCS